MLQCTRAREACEKDTHLGYFCLGLTQKLYRGIFWENNAFLFSLREEDRNSDAEKNYKAEGEEGCHIICNI